MSHTLIKKISKPISTSHSETNICKKELLVHDKINKFKKNTHQFNYKHKIVIKNTIYGKRFIDSYRIQIFVTCCSIIDICHITVMSSINGEVIGIENWFVYFTLSQNIASLLTSLVSILLSGLWVRLLL